MCPGILEGGGGPSPQKGWSVGIFKMTSPLKNSGLVGWLAGWLGGLGGCGGGWVGGYFLVCLPSVTADSRLSHVTSHRVTVQWDVLGQSTSKVTHLPLRSKSRLHLLLRVLISEGLAHQKKSTLWRAQTVPGVLSTCHRHQGLWGTPTFGQRRARCHVTQHNVHDCYRSHI